MSSRDNKILSTRNKSTLCNLCREFTSTIVQFNFLPQEVYPSQRWSKDGEPPFTTETWGDTFRHHDCFDALTLSGNEGGCELCALMLIEYARPVEGAWKPPYEGRLLLYPFMQYGTNQKRRFTMRWSEKKYFPGAPWSPTPHTLHFARARPWYGQVQSIASPDYFTDPEYCMFRDIPSYSDFDDCFVTARDWLRDCLYSHPACVRENSSPLPTRVLDVGSSREPFLYISNGESASYITLSHCWGGEISYKLTVETLEAKKKCIPTASLPRTFQDAVDITRKLGVQYLWIDALCIIQDSISDWQTEALKMASVYTGSTVTISALEAWGSEAGIYHPRNRSKKVLLPSVADDQSQWYIRQPLTPFAEAIEASVLNKRAWVLQERVLPSALLHFTSQQIFWECRSGFCAENGDYRSGSPAKKSLTDVRKFIDPIRKGDKPPGYNPYDLWYELVEDYCARSLTFGTDKLPALAGVASTFEKLAGTHFAGLWREDLFRGIQWGAAYYHGLGRKVWGYQGPDRCSPLSKSEKERAPSWSWASVDGPILFFGRIQGSVSSEDRKLEILDVQIATSGNVFSSADTKGTLRVRGLSSKASYIPPDMGQDVGSLLLSAYAAVDSSKIFRGCVLDIERDKPRSCWVLETLKKTTSRYFLVIEKVGDGTFRRIGYCTSYNDKIESSSLEPREFHIV